MATILLAHKSGFKSRIAFVGETKVKGSDAFGCDGGMRSQSAV